MTANTPKSRKAKARDLQARICKDLREKLGGSDQDIRPAIMGESGTDIKLSSAVLDTFPFSIECKNQETVRFWEWWEQAGKNTKEGTSPLLVIKKARKNPVVVMDWERFLELTLSNDLSGD